MLNQIITQSRLRFDSDARAWIDAVETADAQQLEYGLQKVMDELVITLKAQSLWSLVSTMTIKMGARTVAGALVDIKNPNSSWVNNGFVSGDYSRTTGLAGNGTSKYLNTGRNNNADAQNSFSMFTHVTTLATTASMYYMGGGLLATSGGSTIVRNAANAANLTLTCRSSGGDIDTAANSVANFMGISRAASGSYTSRGNGANQTNSVASSSPANEPILEYAGSNGGVVSAGTYSDHRSCAAGVGAAMTLATMNTVLTTYIARIAALGL